MPFVASKQQFLTFLLLIVIWWLWKWDSIMLRTCLTASWAVLFWHMPGSRLILRQFFWKWYVSRKPNCYSPSLHYSFIPRLPVIRLQHSPMRLAELMLMTAATHHIVYDVCVCEKNTMYINQFCNVSFNTQITCVTTASMFVSNISYGQCRHGHIQHREVNAAETMFSWTHFMTLC